MKALLPLLLALAAPASAPEGRQYLLSIVDLPLEKDERLIAFSFDTWGVRAERVCTVPYGWRITAGGDATPGGMLAGTGGQGVTWFSERNPKPLHNFVLVTLYGPVQPEDQGDVPATFKGEARLSTEQEERSAPLGAANIRLVPAKSCPN
jgi:hypothetical protein